MINVLFSFTSVITIATIGLIISIYAFIVERKLKANPQYKPACDISDRISCSKPMQSPYHALFKLSNTYLALVYYSTIIVLALFGYDMLVFYLSCAGIVVSAIFAYLLYFKIKSLCLVCTSLYLVNIALAVSAYCAFMNQ